MTYVTQTNTLCRKGLPMQFFEQRVPLWIAVAPSLIFGVLLGIGGTSYCLRGGSTGPKVPPQGNDVDAVGTDKPRAANERSIEDARQLQATKQWKAALDKWNALLEHLNSSKDTAPSQIEEAERNRDISKRRAEITPVKIGEKLAIPVPPMEKRPEPIPPERLAECYPVGKKTWSRADLEMAGRGSNRHWGIRTDARFAYVVRVEAETEVLESDPQADRLRIIQRIREVSQTLAVSKQEFQLDLAETPFEEFGEPLVEQAVPAYRMAKKVIEVADPNLKKLLTWMARRCGWDTDQHVLPEQAELRAQIDKLTGAEVQLEYVNGLGVSEIILVKGPELSQAELRHLADTLSLMMDYYILPVKDKRPGDEWVVKSRDVGGMFAVGGLEMTVDGNIQLAQEEPLKDRPDVILLGVRGGTVDLKGEQDGHRQTARLAVTTGTVEFSKQDNIVRDAKLTLQVNALWSDPNSLLFHTEAVRDLKTETRYTSKLLAPGGAKKND